jgi:PilZ domain
MRWIVGWAVGLWSRAEQLVHEQRTDEMNEPGNWLKKLFSRERRRATRKSCVSLVAYYWDGAAPVAHAIRDVSLTGLYLLTDERWYPGTVIEMSLQKTGDSGNEQDRAIRIMVRAIRLDSDGVGLAFVLPYRYGPDLPQEVNIKVLKRFLQGVKIVDHQVDARLCDSEG